ncbi:MAG: sugar phosphate isomerase/epimerase family protein, partial [Collinsella sp.]
CVCPEQNNPKPWNVAVRGEAGQKRILSYFKNVIDVAVELGVPQILVTSGWAYLDEPAEDAWARSVAMLRSVCAYADTRGIRVALEALQPSESVLVNTAQDVARILEAVDRPNLKACIDFGAMEVAGDTIDGYFEVLGDKIVHTHFVDVGGGTTHLARATASVICVPTSRHSCATAIRAMSRPRRVMAATIRIRPRRRLRLSRCIAV